MSGTCTAPCAYGRCCQGWTIFFTHYRRGEYRMRSVNAAALLLIASLATLAGACASKPQVRADGDPTANMSSYKTFGFFDQLATDKSKYSTMITSRLKDATRREMTSRGYQEAQGGPDLLVNFNTN